jgi:hypothetical protein
MSKLDPKLAQMVATSEGRRMLSAVSPSFFDSYYLGLEQAPHRKNWLETIEELQKEAKKINTKKKLLVLSPRGHGKSLLSVSFVLRQLCLNRNASILYISSTAGQAEKRVRLIKQFMDDDKIIEDWCQAPYLPFFGPNSKETASQLYITRSGKSIDPTLEAVGSGGSVTGAHVDIIIIDDLEDDKTTNSPGLRQKTREWIGATLMPILNQGGLLLVIGTRKHEDDVYHHMKNDPTYTVIEESAITEWPDKYEYIFEKDKQGKDILKGVKFEGGKCLWPSFRPMDFLLMERRTMGSLLFEREMQNNVIASEDSIVKEEWIKSCSTSSYTFDFIPPLLKKNNLNIIQSWDLALQTDAKKAQKNDNDWSVGWTLAKDTKTGIIWVLDVMRFRGVSQQTMVDNVEAFYDKWGELVQKIAIETNAFGSLYFDTLKSRGLPIKGVKMTAKNNLKNGIHKIAQKFENNLIRLPVGDNKCAQIVDFFTEEAIKYPYSRHDDMLCALLHGLNEIDQVFQYEVSIGNRIINDEGEIEEMTDFHNPNSMEAFWEQFKQMDEDNDPNALNSVDYVERDWVKQINKDKRSKQKIDNPNYGKPVTYGLDPTSNDDDITNH